MIHTYSFDSFETRVDSFETAGCWRCSKIYEPTDSERNSLNMRFTNSEWILELVWPPGTCHNFTTQTGSHGRTVQYM